MAGFKVYTKTGDDGTTGLFGPGRISKADLRMDCIGLVDGVSSWVGRIMAELGDAYPDQRTELRHIQHYLFDCQSDLANNASKVPWRTKSEAAAYLEQAIDRYDEELQPLNKFILPGGSLVASDCHIARTTTRDAERRLVEFANSADVNPEVAIFINRLSDYFFTLARFLNLKSGVSDEFYDTQFNDVTTAVPDNA